MKTKTISAGLDMLRTLTIVALVLAVANWFDVVAYDVLKLTPKAYVAQAWGSTAWLIVVGLVTFVVEIVLMRRLRNDLRKRQN